jgi:hypothetical protein
LGSESLTKWSDYPHLLAELDMSKNKNHKYGKKGIPCSALDLSVGTMKKLDWKCITCEHEWRATGNGRVTKSTGCPACSNKVINNFDGRNTMAVTHPKLAEEYQGDATKIVAGISKKLDWKCGTCSHEWLISGNSRVSGGRGCPACVNKVIHSEGKNAMATTHPELASECLSDASQVVAGTMAILDWKCLTISETPCRHEWKSNGDNRVRGGNGCPKCGDIKMQQSWYKTKLKNTGSMAETHPKLAEEYQGDATKLTAGTQKKLIWKCLVISDTPCGYEWSATGSHRRNGTGCPDCAKNGFKSSEPAWAYLLKYQFSDGDIKYKQGITNDVKRRVSQLSCDVHKVFPETKVTLIGQKYFEVGQDAKDLETYFLSLRDIRWTPDKKFDGFNEMYAEGILEAWAERL